MTRLTPLNDVQSLDAAIAESADRPVLLFKHSRYCGVSCEALDELQSHMEARKHGTVVYRLITVQTHRPVSDAVARHHHVDAPLARVLDLQLELLPFTRPRSTSKTNDSGSDRRERVVLVLDGGSIWPLQ